MMPPYKKISARSRALVLAAQVPDVPAGFSGLCGKTPRCTGDQPASIQVSLTGLLPGILDVSPQVAALGGTWLPQNLMPKQDDMMVADVMVTLIMMTMVRST